MEAIVGKNVLTHKILDEEYFGYDQKQYKVIDYLGEQENSVLSNYVLLNNFDAFEPDDLFLNGDSLDQIDWIVGDKSENKGVERLLAISSFSKLINTSSLFILSFSILLWTYFYFLNTKERCKTYWLLGLGNIKIYLKEIIIISIIIISFLPMMLFCTKFFNIDHSLLFNYICTYFAIIVFFSIMFIMNRKNHYD